MKHFALFLAEQYEKQSQVDEFVKFAAKQLDLPVPSITLVQEREEGMTTASYNMKTK